MTVEAGVAWKRHAFALTLFVVLTLALFSHRWLTVDPFSVYSMPDVDTDGTLWFIWLKTHSNHLFDGIGLTGTMSYPFGFDLSPFPFDNLIDDLRAAVVKLAGGDWRTLVFVINASALLAYPLTAYTMYLLCWHLTRDQLASVLGAIVFGFAGYFLMLSRGSMANNHFWLVPLVYLFFLRYLESGRISQLVLSCLLTGLQFRINPYWSFYGWLFTPVLMLAQPWPWRQLLRRFSLYALLSGVCLFLLNIQFIQQQWYLITNPVMAGLVRPAGDLLGAIFPQGALLMPGIRSKLYPFSAPMDVGAFLGYSLLTLITLGCLGRRYWRSSYWTPFMVCFVLAVALSSYVPALLPLNQIYFFFFDMFRGVSRVVQLAAFFGGLLIALMVAARPERGRWAYVAAAAFVALYLLEVYPGSPTLKQKTDLGQVARIYESLARDKQVSAIASYPMTYYNLSWGTAPLYEVVGQVIHRKPIAGAKDLRLFQRDGMARPLLGEIDNPLTIDNLARHGINRIVIYNRVLEQAPRINAQLSADPRLAFLGRHSLPERECGVSLLCRSLDISVYEIKTAVRLPPGLLDPAGR
ncbi:hypothetical protein [Chitinimonas lacunae]|uniref:YfhO family protein n=1 Tax=Chitinimonas lacunae TaxID=1963018 RepID=A0ABV8MUR6_9NEIS